MTHIAKVPVTVYLAGKKTVLPPGATLPELDPEDIASLTRLRAIEAGPSADAPASEEPKKGPKK